MPYFPCVMTRLVCLALTFPAIAQVHYSVTDLGRVPGYTYSTNALGINNRGDIVGFGHSGSVYKAFIWRAGVGIQALPLVPGHETESSTATAINDFGDVVGFSGQDNGVDMFGWIYRNGQYTMLGTLPGMRGTKPLAINNLGEVVGAATPTSGLDPTDTFYWSPATGIVDITPGARVAEVFDINDSGVVCGGLRTDPPSGITMWNMRTGAVSDLGMLPGTLLSFGYGINETGEVAGVSTYITTGGTRTAHPVLAIEEQPLLDLNIFQSAGISINDQTEIVGSARYLSNPTYLGWVWRSGMLSPMILHDHIDLPTQFSRVENVRAINNRGQIIASSNNGSLPSPAEQSRRAILLTPIANCPSDFGVAGPLSITACVGSAATFSVAPEPIASGPFTFEWQIQPQGSTTWTSLGYGNVVGLGIVTGARSATLRIANAAAGAAINVRCVVTNPCGSITSDAATLFVSTSCCDSIDFNNDGSSFDPQDIDAFLSIYSEGPCIPATATCNDIDFNNDLSLFDPCDIDSFLLVFSEAPCTMCGF